MTKSKLAGAAIAVLLTTSLGACNKIEAAKPAADTAKLADAAKAQAAALVAGFNAHDANKAVSEDAPDYVGMMHGTVNVKGPAEDLAMTKQQLADPATKLVVSDESVDVASAGDMAIYRATYAYTYTDAKTKKPTTETGNWVVGYKPKSDGSLQAAWSVVSDTPAAAPTPATK